MKPGLKNIENADQVLDIVEYYQKSNTTNKITRIGGTEDFSINFEAFYDVLRDMEDSFKDEIKIVNIYDHINDEHWMNPPRPGDPEHRPIAELRITGPVGKLRSLVESEYRDLVSNQIEVSIDKKNGLYIKSQPDKSYELQYKIKNVVTKRFRLIQKLSKAKGTVRGPKLRSELGYSTIPLLSQEIRKINFGCRERAGLFDDLIDHQNTGGYQINPRYRISFK